VTRAPGATVSCVAADLGDPWGYERFGNESSENGSEWIEIEGAGTSTLMPQMCRFVPLLFWASQITGAAVSVRIARCQSSPWSADL
jgi:hypothetical protein